MQILPATEAHCLALAERMRPADAREVMRSGGNTPVDAVVLSMQASQEAWAALEDGAVLAVFGVVPLAGVGVCWSLTSTEVDARPLTFWRASKEVIRDLRTRWPHLFNFIDADYDAAIRWARRLGFSVSEPVPFGVAQLPFCRVELRSPPNV